MSRREIALLIAGLVIGLLVGTVMIGSNEGLRTALFGAAATPPPEPAPAYYLVDLPTVSEWLTEAQPEMGEELRDAVDQVVGLSTLADLTDEFVNAENTVKTALTGIYAALVGAEAAEGIAIEARQPNALDADLSLCLGMDYSPYLTEPTMYLYVTVPADQVVDVPDEWERLENPKQNDIFWLLLGCYGPEKAS